jgi:hypothetical protein
MDHTMHTERPTGRALTRMAVTATLHCLTVMEIVDNAILLVVPGAMNAHLDSPLFWASLAFALAVAFVVTVPVNRWLIGRGKGHAVVHQYHGGGHGEGSHEQHLMETDASGTGPETAVERT